MWRKLALAPRDVGGCESCGYIGRSKYIPVEQRRCVQDALTIERQLTGMGPRATLAHGGPPCDEGSCGSDTPSSYQRGPLSNSDLRFYLKAAPFGPDPFLPPFSSDRGL